MTDEDTGATTEQIDRQAPFGGIIVVNQTLDAVIGPLNVAAEYVDRISKGDMPPKISDRYNGDFNELKNNLNTCIDAVNALVADTKILAKAAVEGKLATIDLDRCTYCGACVSACKFKAIVWN